MSKSPGQKAYEAACKFAGMWPRWEDADAHDRLKYEVIAAAVIASEPKSYGEVLFDLECENGMVPPDWKRLEREEQSDFESVAGGLIAEFKRREGIK